ncbi:MAG TPA: hypothetical protein VHZ56_05515 [Devosia sp.]|nr:hypothetical protein [Devosia sp.]
MRASAAVSIAALVAAVMAVPETAQDAGAGSGQDSGWDSDADLLAAANDNDSRVSRFGTEAAHPAALRADGSVGAGEG